jgi:ATP-binding cassette subfamily B protein
MQQNSVLNSQIIEGLRAVETIKGGANEDVELEYIEREYIRSLRISFKEGMLSNAQTTIAGLIHTCGNMALMYFGISQSINNSLTLGSLMAFITLASFFTDPVGRLVGLQLRLQEANISMKRLTEILDTKREQDIDDESLFAAQTTATDIDIINISFSYGCRKPVIKDLSFTIPSGKKVALIGASGSGKSTVAKLLLKYYEPNSGGIYIGGTDIREISNASLRKNIAYVPQNIELFSRTIYDNIRISKINSTLDEVKGAAKLADAHEFISRMPSQYGTLLEEAGAGLSGGERQRIAIARAFLKNSGFYILDESTSNLDFGTENAIFDMIYNKLRDKTMLIIAHRLATIRNCDKIIVLRDGTVAEQGTHDELLAHMGTYYRMWNMQQGIRIEDTRTEEESAAISYSARDNEEVTYS